MSTEKIRFSLKDFIEEYQKNRDYRLAQGQRGYRPTRPTPQTTEDGTTPLEAYAKKRLERERASHGIKPKDGQTK